jgi:Flp pilus assembly pilin Flp
MLLGLYSRMLSMWSDLRSRMTGEDGAVATEYVILLVLIAIAITVGAVVLAGAINAQFSAASSCVSGLPGAC